MEIYLNDKLCQECGGGCCKRLPGIAFPDDFTKPLLETLIKLFKSGKWVIDWWEADEPGYFIRPAIKNCSKLFDPAWRGECIFLTPTGCELSPEKRPIQCRMLEPKADPERCISHAGEKWEAKKAWESYIPIILEAAEG